MLDPAAILRFVDKQKRLLRDTYDSSWQRGVDSYEPDEDPDQEPTLPRQMAVAGLTGVAALAVARQYAYTPPTSPDALRRAVALAPAYKGLNQMAADLSTGGLGQISAFTPEGLSEWASSNGWRLNASGSVAWAGEQAGYAEAANADGQLLYGWMSVGDSHVCNDCEMLDSYPPMALGDWPTSPGAGDTECSVGCRCSWDTFGAPTSPDYSPQLTDAQQALSDDLQQRQLQTLADLMPDAAYLE